MIGEPPVPVPAWGSEIWNDVQMREQVKQLHAEVMSLKLYTAEIKERHNKFAQDVGTAMEGIIPSINGHDNTFQQTTTAIDPGVTGEMVVFAVESSLIAGFQPVVTADEDEGALGQYYECDEDNNAETWHEAVCD